jgi:hypothetical protein
MRTVLAAAAITAFAGAAHAAGPGFGGPGFGGGFGFGGGPGHGPNRPGGHRPHQAPEIDVMSGLGAVATLGALGALAWERRRRGA